MDRDLGVDRDGQHVGCIACVVVLQALEVVAPEFKRLERCFPCSRAGRLLREELPCQLRGAHWTREDESLESAADADPNSELALARPTADVIPVHHASQRTPKVTLRRLERRPTVAAGVAIAFGLQRQLCQLVHRRPGDRAAATEYRVASKLRRVPTSARDHPASKFGCVQIALSCLSSPGSALSKQKNPRISGGFLSTATGIRTRVTAVRGRRPSPLDDSGVGCCSSLE
jgi:hypothetical protein